MFEMKNDYSDENNVTAETETTSTVEPTPTPQKNKTDEYSAKYGVVYKIGITVPIDDMEDREFSYHFKRPAVAAYDRYVQTLSKIGVTNASNNFMLDSVIAEDKERLMKDIGEWPGVAITISQKLTSILGLVDNVNLKRI